MPGRSGGGPRTSINGVTVQSPKGTKHYLGAQPDGGTVVMICPADGNEVLATVTIAKDR